MDSSLDHPAPSVVDADEPAQTSSGRGPRFVVLVGAVLFIASLAWIEYDVIDAGGAGPSGFTPGILFLVLAPTCVLAAWLYASEQALRTFLLCLYPPFAANAAVWGLLAVGRHFSVDVRITVAVVACGTWLILLPLLAWIARRITATSRVRGPRPSSRTRARSRRSAVPTSHHA